MFDKIEDILTVKNIPQSNPTEVISTNDIENFLVEAVPKEMNKKHCSSTKILSKTFDTFFFLKSYLNHINIQHLCNSFLCSVT
jgi:hypothetical protein